MKTLKASTLLAGSASVRPRADAPVHTNTLAATRWHMAWNEWVSYRQAADEPQVGHTLLAALVDVFDTTRQDERTRRAIINATPDLKTYKQEFSRLAKLANWQLGIFGEAERAPSDIDLPLTMAKDRSISTVYKEWSKAVRADLVPSLTTDNVDALADHILSSLVPDPETGKAATTFLAPLPCLVTLATGDRVQRQVKIDLTQNALLLTAAIQALQALRDEALARETEPTAAFEAAPELQTA